MGDVSIPDSRLIREMFDRISGDYDRFNRWASLGLDALWRRSALAVVRPGMRVLDLGTGTGDLALGAARRLGGRGEVVGIDFSVPMLILAEEKRRRRRLEGVRWEARRAEEVPFEAEPYDAVVSAFVLRNIHEHLETILEGVRRALKPGGVVSFVDLTEPEHPWARRLGFFYVNRVIEFLGRSLFRDPYPVRYLTESMARFHRASGFRELLRRAGFEEVASRSFLFGMVTHYTARAPAGARA
jgi:demethylmenaquinone methyltransferase/2-methoxy-6-polyprenyl-1,4-benzoquinol methylase